MILINVVFPTSIYFCFRSDISAEDRVISAAWPRPGTEVAPIETINNGFQLGEKATARPKYTNTLFTETNNIYKNINNVNNIALYGGAQKKGRNSKKKILQNSNFFASFGIEKPLIFITGNFNQDNIKLFGEITNNKQCTANAVASIIFAFATKLKNWSNHTLDSILNEGNKIYLDFKKK